MRPNLLDPNLYVTDPSATYAWLRRHAPAYWDEESRIWGISRWVDVRAIEFDTRRYSSGRGSRPHLDMTQSMINKDDPDHRRQRNLVQRRFSPWSMHGHEQHVRGIVTELLDSVAQMGQAEVVEDLAAALPSIVICDLIGFDRSLWPECKRWSELIMGDCGSEPYEAMSPQTAVQQAMLEFTEAAVALAEARKLEPRDDLMSVWSHAMIDGAPMDPMEVLLEALLVLTGGSDTTRAVIGLTVLALLDHPAERDKLLADPSLLRDSAVEEFIRWATPVLSMRRTATEEHELHGQTIRAGDELLLLYASANRDEEAFDAPDHFDVTRTSNHHLAFGFGSHVCLGANLARLEIRVMFEELLRRLPDFRLAPGVVPEIVPGFFTRTLRELPIEFTPEPATVS